MVGGEGVSVRQRENTVVSNMMYLLLSYYLLLTAHHRLVHDVRAVGLALGEVGQQELQRQVGE